MTIFKKRALALAASWVVVLAFGVGLSSSANAAFPGGNGIIAFSAYRNNALHIYTMNPDGSSKTQLTNGAWEEYPSWSPGGTRIVYDGVVGGAYEIFSMNGDGTDQTQLTDLGALSFRPSWSSDGNQITFGSTVAGKAEIFTMDADGSNLTQLTFAGFNWAPAWSPKGNVIAYNSFTRATGTRIASIFSDGTGMSVLTTGPNDADPGWSPSANKIIFESGHVDPGGRAEGAIFTINPSGSGRRKIAGTRDSSYAEFSPDGSRIVYSHLDRHAIMYTANVNGSDKVKLNTRSDALDPDWQPQVV
jgi:Tol biopolymer transport system component